jgi:hypothetical protein
LLADDMLGGRVKSDLHIDTITTAASRVNVTRSIGVDAVGKASSGVCEELSVLQPLAVGRDVEAVDGRGLGCVCGSGEGLVAGV